MYFQRKSKVRQNRPSVCNYHHGSHATAPQIRFTPRNHILNLLAVGMENLLCNGKGAPYFGRVEFEGGLWRSALSLRAKWRRHYFRPAPPTVCALGKASLTFVRLTFTPLRRFIKIGQGNFQSFGHPH
jgi:hypothetical protein